MLIHGVFFLGDENIVGRSVLVLALIFLLLFLWGVLQGSSVFDNLVGVFV